MSHIEVGESFIEETVSSNYNFSFEILDYVFMLIALFCMIKLMYIKK